MPNLAQLRRKSAPVEVRVAGVTIAVNYRPDRLTLDTLQELQELRGRETVERLKEILIDLLIDWDITEEDGSALPIDKQTLGVIPLDVLNAVQVALVQSAGDTKNPPRR